MKKILSLGLSFLLLISIVFSLVVNIKIFANSEELVSTNIALGKAYTKLGAGYDNKYLDTNNVQLTDGIYASTPDYWVGAYVGFNTNSDDFEDVEEKGAEIVVDLDGLFNITKFAIETVRTNSGGINAPKSVSAYVSNDKVSWAKVGDLSFEGFDKTKAGIFKPTLEAETSGRYVKLVFEHDTTWIFVSEVEVYGFEKEEIISKSVTVVNGKGGGDYAEGEIVNLTANQPPARTKFDKWVSSSDIVLADPTSQETTFEMIDSEVTVEASYIDLLPEDNAALGKSYTKLGIDSGYPDAENKQLTDGLYASTPDYWVGAYVGFNSKSPDFDDIEVKQAEIVVDLEASYEIVQFVIETARTNSGGINAPKNITAFVSDDKDIWTKVGVLSFEGFDKDKGGIFLPSLDANTEGRYVKFVFEHDTPRLFVSEVEVYGYKIPEPKFKVTVVNGKGSGEYITGETVNITANSAPKGKEFDSWVATDNIALVDINDKSTSFVMVESDVTVEATYKDLPPEMYLIEVLTEGKGNASADLEKAKAGEKITLTASANVGSIFKEWQVVEGEVTLTGDSSATFTMPENKVIVKAIFEEIKYKVTVVNGEGSGDYILSSTVNITANSAPNGKEFDKWISNDNITFTDSNAKSTTFTMIADDVTVEATYKDLPPEQYLIEVLTEGSGTAYSDFDKAKSGEKITLTAVASRGSIFKEWQVVEGGVTIEGVIDASFTMPENKVVVKAIFEEEVIEPIKYLISNIENDEWEEGSDFGITIETDADFDKFVELRINDEVVDTSNYELKEGSTILTLNAEYLSTLSVGKYNVELVFVDGSAKSEISILEKEEDEPVDDVPQTSDYTILFILLAILTFSVTTYTIRYYHRKGLC